MQFSPWHIPYFRPCPYNHFCGSVLLLWPSVLGQASIVRAETGGIVIDRSPAFPISNRRDTHSPSGCNGKPVFCPHIDPPVPKENECSSVRHEITARCHQWSGYRSPWGNGQETPVPHLWCLHQSEKCKNWKQKRVQWY